jgi:hypothetical protein
MEIWKNVILKWNAISFTWQSLEKKFYFPSKIPWKYIGQKK